MVAIGTTVVRALESATNGVGDVEPRQGWTSLTISPRTEVRSVDAFFTGLHEPPATHLDMLRAFAGDTLLEPAYAEMRDRGYLWHEFGDATLITGRAGPTGLSGPR